MNAKQIMRLVAILFVLVAVGSFASAATWYIDGTNGDDAFGNGTQLNPYRSITKGISVAASGDVLSIAAAIYDNAAVNHSGDVGTITVAGTMSLTFVSTTVGAATTAILTNGLNWNSSGTLSIGQGASQFFNLGTTATALTVTKGAVTLTTANVIIGNGGTLTIVDGTLSAPPTITTNLNVSYTGTTAVSSATHIPANIGNGTITINTTASVTVPQALQCGTISVVAGSASFSADVNASVGINLAGTGAVSFAGVTSLGNITNANTGGVSIAGNLVLGKAAVVSSGAPPATGTVAVTPDFINNAASGTVTIGTSAGNTVTLFGDGDAGATIANLGQIINAAAGTVTVNSSVVINLKNTTVGASFPALNVIDNQSTGTLSVAGTITANNVNFFTSGTANNVGHTLAINGAAGGTVSIGAIITPVGAAGAAAVVNINIANAGTMSTRAAALLAGTVTSTGGTLTLGQVGDAVSGTGAVSVTVGTLNLNANCVFGTSSVASSITTAAGTTVNINNSASSLAGILTNAGKIVLGSNTFTLSGTGAGVLNNTGDIYSTATATIGTGTLKFTGTAPTIVGGGNMPALQFECATAPAITSGGSVYGTITKNAAGTLTINGATIARGDIQFNAGNIAMVGAGLTVNGTFFMNSGAGTFGFGANTLDLKGDFNRTGGTIGVTDAGTGTLQFSGSNVQNFTPGVQMTAYNVVVNNTGIGVLNQDIITQNGSLIVLNNYTITAGKVNLGLSNIRMAEVAGAIFTNGGRGYTATGVGGIIFQGTGAAAQMGGTNAYSNVYIRLSNNANNVVCNAAVVVSGILSLEGGGITWNTAAFTSSTLTLSDVLTTPAYPTVVVRTDNRAGALMVDGADGGAVALAIVSKYNLTYIGPASRAASGNEWIGANIQNLSINVDDGLTVTGPLAGTTITGILTIAGGATGGATLDANAQTLTASASVTHSVAGKFQNGTLSITGAAAGITGSVGVSPIDAASISTLGVTGASFTSTNLKVITNLTYNNATGSATITMNRATATVGNVLLTAGTMALDMNATASAQSGNLTVTAGSLTYTRNGGAAGTRTIAGTVTLTGGTLTLGSKVDITTALAQVNGALALGANDMSLVGTYTRTGTGAISGTGQFIAAPGVASVAYTLNAGAKIPQLTLNPSAGGAASGIQLVGAGLEVTNSFTHTQGILDLQALNLTLSGSIYNYTAGTYVSTGGALILTGTTATLGGNPTIPRLTINSVGHTVTLVSTDNTTPTPRTINVSVALVHTDGIINLGINSIALTDNGVAAATYTRGLITALFTQGVTGALIFNATVGTHTLNQGTTADTLVIPNLTINTATNLGTTKTLMVAQNLVFGANFGTGADGRLILGNGAIVTRNGAGVLSNLPAFGTTVNNVYSAAVTTDKELTTSTTALMNLTINAPGPVVLNAPTTVNGKLTLNAALTTTSPKLITMGGTTATLVVSGGSISAPVIATVYNLEYSTPIATTIVTDDNTWPALASVNTLTFSGAGTKQLHANRNVTGLLTLKAGTFDLQGFKITVSGDITFTNGTITNAAVPTSELILSGAATQTITLNGNMNVPANVNVRLAKTGVAVARLIGGDLNFNTNTSMLFLDAGVLSTVSLATTPVIQSVIIARPTSAAVFFTRTAGMIYGKAKYPVFAGDGAGGTNGTFDFPVGTLDGKYRPATIAFTPNYVAMTPTNLEVMMVDQNPGGVRGLPVVESATLKIGGYPNFYWRVATTPTSMLATQQFDVILQSAANIGYPYDQVTNLRIVRRQDGDAESNTWAIQGSAASYAAGNYIQVIGTDSILFVRSSSSQGGIVAQGTILTIGVPTRKPAFVQAVAKDTVEQIGTIVNTFVASPSNIGEQATLSLVNPPVGATLSATIQQTDGNAQATLTYAPTFATAPGLVPIVIRATNTSGFTVDTTFTVLVTRSASKPTWTAALGATTITDGQLLNFTYTVSLPAGDTARFRAVALPTGATMNTTSGAFAWTPYFAQAGHNYTVSIRAYNKRDTTLFVDTTATITVNHRYARGDADGSGSVLPADASRVLRFVAGLVTSLGDSAHVWAADASANGTVTAFDASLILQYAAGIITTLPPTGKAPAAEGTLAWGRLAQTEAALALPLKVSGASNIFAVQFTANIGSLEVEAVKANLPKDWELQYRAADGKLYVAAAGVTPISDGDIATISFKNIAYTNSVDVVADAMMNESINMSLQAQVRPIPTKFALENNYPNPFNPTTTIRYALPQDARVNVIIYNIQGQIVRTLVGADQTAGYYTIQWDGRSDAGMSVASGIYIYRINAGSFVSAKKMVMLK